MRVASGAEPDSLGEGRLLQNSPRTVQGRLARGRDNATIGVVFRAEWGTVGGGQHPTGLQPRIQSNRQRISTHTHTVSGARRPPTSGVLSNPSSPIELEAKPSWYGRILDFNTTFALVDLIMSDKGKSPVGSPAKGKSPGSSPPPAGDQMTTVADILPASYWHQVLIIEDPEPADGDRDSVLDDLDAQSSTASLTDSILRYRTLNGRTYHSKMGTAEAWQPNDDTHAEVMDMNHHLNTLILGGELFLAPIPADVQNVLDVGTGTGIWAMSVLFTDTFLISHSTYILTHTQRLR